MMGLGFAQVILLTIALGLILGVYTRGQAFRKLTKVLLVVSLIPILIGIGKSYFYHLPDQQKLIAGLSILMVGALIMVRILLGKEVVNEVMGRLVFKGLKAGFLLPFKIITGIIRRYK